MGETASPERERTGQTRGRIFEDAADYIVVGTGAGGATAARVLAEAGHTVIMLEEGGWLNRAPSALPPTMLSSFRKSFRGIGSVTTQGTAPIPLLQGRCVGGSTAINCGILWRMPEDVKQDWRDNFGLDELVDDGALARIFAQLEQELEAAETSEDLFGGNGALMAAAAKALGLPGKAMVRNAARCVGSAQCNLGCPTGARQSMEVSYVPRAQKHGARLYTGMRATKVRKAQGRAAFVEGKLSSASSQEHGGAQRFKIHARKGVVIACGVVHTPLLLQSSGIKRTVGERFQAHPGVAIVGRFGKPVRMNQGATQAFEVPMRDRGFKLESLAVPAEMVASRIPGVGSFWQERVSELDHFAQWAAIIRMRTHGRVKKGLFGEPAVTFCPSATDLETAREAIALLCRMMFEAGATEVYPGLRGHKEVLSAIEDVDAIEQAPLAHDQVHMIISHLFGTACASSEASQGVVGPDLQCFDMPGLYVADASVFPTNMGVNPQHSIQAVVWRAMEQLA